MRKSLTLQNRKQDAFKRANIIVDKKGYGFSYEWTIITAVSEYNHIIDFASRENDKNIILYLYH